MDNKKLRSKFSEHCAFCRDKDRCTDCIIKESKKYIVSLEKKLKETNRSLEYYKELFENMEPQKPLKIYPNECLDSYMCMCPVCGQFLSANCIADEIKTCCNCKCKLDWGDL